uniref:Uncharacterized protein n=1 Tax=Ochrobactrum phage ORM_20 TaxID=2985243 RepID=A0A9N6WZH6_9VIRU|nr:hypothetical protein ORM20_00139 [Ochrobactrum phage ORM_20]
MINIKLLAIAFQNGQGNCFKPLVVLKLQPDNRLSIPGLPIDTPSYPGVNTRILKDIDPSTTLVEENILLSNAWAVEAVATNDSLLVSQLGVFKNDVKELATEFFDSLLLSGDYKVIPFEKIERMNDADFYEGHRSILLQHFTSQDSTRLGIWREAS